MPELVDRLRAALADRYAVGERLGSGGMAVVFVAEDRRHRRKVAVKVMLPELARAIGRDRFLREIEVAARLQHPHILPVYDSGEAGGQLFYVMPLVEGGTLRARLNREKQLPVEEAIQITREVAEALGYAHEQGVIHRDIKPENILFSAGQAVVADFGIAGVLDAPAGAPLTATGTAVGTPDYMSPEQSSGAAEPRSDIYSLACVLYEMLAGHPPFTGFSMQEILSRHAMDAVPGIRAARATIPDALEQVVIKALAKQPVDRFATSRQFGEALQAAVRSSAPASAAASAASPPRLDPNAIAVLPFANLSGDPEKEFLSDGIAEELMNALGRVDGLRVVARTSAFRFKGADEDIRAIGQQLNVGTILEGSVRATGNRVRVTSHLVNVADGYRLWSEQFDRQLDDVFAIQDEIASAIAGNLKVKLAAPQPVGRRTDNPKAYELFLKGRHHWNRRSEAELRKGIEYFQQALALDPELAVAQAGLADSYSSLGIYGAAPPADVMPAARNAALKAIELDETLPAAHTSLAVVRAVYDWDWATAERDFRRAIELGPNYATAPQWYATSCLIPRGRFEEAEVQLRRARELDPLSPSVGASLGVRSYYAREYDRAVGELLAGLELNPDFSLAHFFLGQAHVAQGKHADALRSLERAVELSGGSAETVAALGYGYAVAGKKSEAKARLSMLLERAQRGYVSPSFIAQVRAGLGETGEALACLERAGALRAADLAWVKFRPAFDALRAEPRFTVLTERMGL
ncbi:MAG: protein kinase [Gemmatimonadetes bacterium]|nr:protein kinase [Gemmatimonadota bacterium]